MTNAIEVTKREMYDSLAILKGRIKINYSIKDMQRGADEFENTLEAHLEELRKAMVTANEIITRCSNHSLNTIRDLGIQIDNVTEERDNLRNRLQAFEFANKSAGEFLQAAQAKVKSQRQSIGQLKNDRNNAQALAAVNYQKYQNARQELSELRKSLMATPTQDSKENAKKEASEAYQAGFNGVGTPNPHATGTLNHLHWMEGARAKMNFLGQNTGFGGTQFVEFKA